VSQEAGVVDQQVCRLRCVEIVQRASGGTAVLVNGAAFSLDVALPASHPLAAADVVLAYRWLGAVLAASVLDVAPAADGRLEVVGPTAARADQQAARAARVGSGEALRVHTCFGTLSPYEVVITDGRGQRRKLFGLAQLRKRGVVLFQAGVYSWFSGKDMAELLKLPPQSQAALGEELDTRVADLADVGLTPADASRLMEAFVRRADAASSRAALSEQTDDPR
jgi:lipoate-protein ligase A